MTSARMAIDDYCFKVQCNKILAKCKWLPIIYMINNAQCYYIHIILMNKNPTKIFDLFIVPNRKVKEIRIQYQSKTKLSKSSLLFNGLELYNKLPPQLKQLPIKKIKTQLKKHFFKIVNT